MAEKKFGTGNTANMGVLCLRPFSAETGLGLAQMECIERWKKSGMV